MLVRCYLLFILFLSITAFACKAAEDQEEMANAAEKIRNLNDLEKFYLNFRKHSDSSVSEMYSESVSTMLDEKWDEIINSDLLEKSTVSEALSFGINEDWEYRRFLRILKHAKSNCSERAKDLCNRIKALESSSVDSPYKK